jgi:uncharacterized membrane protein YjdF
VDTRLAGTGYDLDAPTGRRPLTRQLVLLGDWTRWIRDPQDVLRLLYVLATVVWGLTGRPVAFLTCGCVALLLARAVSLPRFYDFSMIVAWTLLAWGEMLGFYDSWTGYDNVVHTSVPFLVTGVVYLLLVRLGVLPQLDMLTQAHQRIGFFLTALALGMAIGAGWEIVEWTLDSTTGSHLVIDATDTATDLIWDSIGAAGSSLVLVLWSLGGHSLTRRSGAALADKPLASFLTPGRSTGRSHTTAVRS